VSGVMTVRDYEDREGNKRKAYEVVCESVELLGSRSNTAAEEAELPEAAPFEELTDDGELPF